MNLLGHFACATGRAPALQAGAMLPDLLTIFRRKPRLALLTRAWEEAPRRGGRMEAITAGVAFHHHVDIAFHRAPLFTETAGALRLALAEANGGPGLKRFFAAHLICELYLDHLLLSDGRELARQFHKVLAGERDGLVAYVGRHPEVVAEDFDQFLGRVWRDRLVEDYRTLEGVRFRTDRVLQRLSQRTLTGAEVAAVERLLAREKEGLRLALLQFVAAMQQWEEHSGLAPAYQGGTVPPRPSAHGNPSGLTTPEG